MNLASGVPSEVAARNARVYLADSRDAVTAEEAPRLAWQVLWMEDPTVVAALLVSGREVNDPFEFFRWLAPRRVSDRILQETLTLIGNEGEQK